MNRTFSRTRAVGIPGLRWTAYDAMWFNLNTGKEFQLAIQTHVYNPPV